MTRLITTIAEMRDIRASLTGRVGLVPTMGSLHDGHLTLMRRAREQSDVLIVSDFVNPLQFGPNEDYDRYPRDLDGDLAKVDGLADYLFAPSAEEMYPAEEPFQVDVGRIGTVFEGAIRPGHFNGVATVVLKLFIIIRPDIAVFGQKDAQQLAVIRRLVRDFNVPVDIIPAPISREGSGLARSSRNAYLDEDGRWHALALSGLLKDLSGRRMPAPELLHALEQARATSSTDVQWDYAEAVDPATFEPIDSSFTGDAVVIVAARVQGVRLLDNAEITVGT
ncbi:pantoate--beta-alanine ligase [Helcobacillus massiliensis]|uniref:pantoate--beta-alanine ligase n=1 Tax=Helcobacillus massiliensis TaxID=521392 RepID=UPI0021A5BFAB|nr:pantoate--beta-alanine ligase [Helcobacillus massiliensis]MCT1558248.1 pantoate--beta-alanine ligase [Helcobacillus massiliensis]MCT2035513.1 pantoate--beta-alanine ligase [Helcobacillus massiliensis]MCT2331992.1 pantoate--beta-alanine ligase [Helcobacillus massiliensis]